MTTSRRSGRPSYSTLDPAELDLARWRERWLPSLQQDGLLIGLNWTGPRAKGYDFTPNEVIARLNAATVPPPPG